MSGDIPRSVMEEARALLNIIIQPDYVRSNAADYVARALFARDKRAAEIVRRRVHAEQADNIVAAILNPEGKEDGL